jgi:hypothetical protein
MNKTNIILIILLLIVIALAVVLFMQVRGEGERCILNPGSYLITKLENTNYASISCSCLAFSSDGSFNFGINSSGLFGVKKNLTYGRI